MILTCAIKLKSATHKNTEHEGKRRQHRRYEETRTTQKYLYSTSHSINPTLIIHVAALQFKTLLGMLYVYMMYIEICAMGCMSFIEQYTDIIGFLAAIIQNQKSDEFTHNGPFSCFVLLLISSP